MEDRVILHMDTTTLKEQSTLWQLRKHSICPSPDSSMLAFAPCHRVEVIVVRGIIVYDIAGPGILHFQQNIFK